MNDFEVLPDLEKRIINLLHDFMKEDGGAFHTWEIAVFLPAANAFLHYLDGVNIALKSDNYVSTLANLRGLLESLGAIIYDGTAKLSPEAYERFLKTGRLPKIDDSTGKMTDIGSRELAKYVQQMVDPKIKIVKIYDNCCDILHFSSAHMSFLGGIEPIENVKDRLVKIKIGTKDKISVSTRRQILSLCGELATVLGQCIVMGTSEKSRRATKK